MSMTRVGWVCVCACASFLFSLPSFSYLLSPRLLYLSLSQPTLDLHSPPPQLLSPTPSELHQPEMSASTDHRRGSLARSVTFSLCSVATKGLCHSQPHPWSSLTLFVFLRPERSISSGRRPCRGDFTDFFFFFAAFFVEMKTPKVEILKKAKVQVCISG